MVTTLGGDYARGLGINASGQVTGYSNLTAGGSNTHGFLTGPNGEGVIDLGTFAGDDTSIGRAINDKGQITGISYSSATGNGIAFLYSNGKLQDLNSMINPADLPANIRLVDGWAISNNGLILAEGANPSATFSESFLLTPNPVPSN